MAKNIKNEESPSKHAGSDNTRQDFSGLQLVEFGDSTGFACDVETGFCGPIDQKKEDKK